MSAFERINAIEAYARSHARALPRRKGTHEEVVVDPGSSFLITIDRTYTGTTGRALAFPPLTNRTGTRVAPVWGRVRGQQRGRIEVEVRVSDTLRWCGDVRAALVEEEAA